MSITLSLTDLSSLSTAKKLFTPKYWYAVYTKVTYYL